MTETGSHQVIARKWRPARFADVVGQDHVKQTLRNAVAKDRVGHAYLLVGPRGIGKTTLARIFAKAINCEHPQDGEPCCECASCKAIAAESSLDVQEIDAASRNSVDHMRALSEEACHLPVSSKYKIYIIDEVHMLSKSAWNALLKTVEEPPSHVKFIFATTEAHLVLPTIVSRCQRFDLSPIPTRLILERLRKIAAAEGVAMDDAALAAIARAAGGGMRDAQSSLEQMISFFGGGSTPIKAEEVLELFGFTNGAELDALLAAMVGNDPGTVVSTVSRLARRGRNLETLFDDLLEMLRAAELCNLVRDPAEVLEWEPERLERARKLAALTTPGILRSFMEELTPVGRTLHEALNKAVYLESILLRAMHEAHAPRIGDVLARLNQLRTAGELRFLEQVPSLAAQPVKPAAPVPPPPPVAPVIPEASAVPVPPAAPAAPVVEKAAPPVEPKPAASVEEMLKTLAPAEPPAEPPAAKNVEPTEPKTETPEPPAVTAAALWQQLCAAAVNAGIAAGVLDAGRAETLDHAVLTVRVAAEQYEPLHAELPQLQTILQNLTGDWASLLKLLSDAPQAAEPVPEPAPEEEPAVPDIPAAPAEPLAAPLTLAEAPEPEIPPSEPVPEPAPEELGCGGEPEMDPDEAELEAEDESGIVEMPVPPLPGSVLAEEPPVESAKPEPEASPAAAKAEEPEAPAEEVKRSVFHRPEVLAETRAMAPVQMALELFEGEIVDIHA